MRHRALFMRAAVVLLAAGIVTSKLRSRRARLVAALLIPLFFVGMTVSGTRAALIILLNILGQANRVTLSRHQIAAAR